MCCWQEKDVAGLAVNQKDVGPLCGVWVVCEWRRKLVVVGVEERKGE